MLSVVRSDPTDSTIAISKWVLNNCNIGHGVTHWHLTSKTIIGHWCSAVRCEIQFKKGPFSKSQPSFQSTEGIF